jgi:hypothetical protein
MAWTFEITRRQLELNGTTVFGIDYLQDGSPVATKELAFPPGTSRDVAIAEIVSYGRRVAAMGVPLNVGETGQVR